MLTHLAADAYQLNQQNLNAQNNDDDDDDDDVVDVDVDVQYVDNVSLSNHVNVKGIEVDNNLPYILTLMMYMRPI